MNVLFFLTPKSQIKYVTSLMSIRQVMEIMEFHRYSSVPLLTKDGKYIGVVSEGDILYFLKNNDITNINSLNTINILRVLRYRDYKEMPVDTDMNSLINVVSNQNFVPIVDDSKHFIGIVTRKSIINYLSKTHN